MKVTMILIVIGVVGCHQQIETGIGGLGYKRMSGDHPNNSILGIGPSIKKSPGDLWRRDIIPNLVENHQLMMV